MMTAAGSKAEIIAGMKKMLAVFSKAEAVHIVDEVPASANPAQDGSNKSQSDNPRSGSHAHRASGRDSAKVGIFSLVEQDVELMIAAANDSADPSSGEEEERGIGFEAFVRMIGPSLEPDAPLATDQEATLQILRDMQAQHGLKPGKHRASASKADKATKGPGGSKSTFPPAARKQPDPRT